MNKVILVGRLVRDPEYSATENWTPVCTFTLAVNREYKGEDGRKVADFFRVVAWNDLADLVRKLAFRPFKRLFALCGQPRDLLAMGGFDGSEPLVHGHLRRVEPAHKPSAR